MIDVERLAMALVVYAIPDAVVKIFPGGTIFLARP